MQHHLAILRPEYLSLILSGRKTVECRIGRRPIPPHGAITTGDVIWLKESSGPVCGVAQAGRVLSHDRLNAAQLSAIRREHNHAVCGNTDFWRSRRGARYATLIWLTDVATLPPFRIAKTDRRAWVVLDAPPVPVGFAKSHATCR